MDGGCFVQREAAFIDEDSGRGEFGQDERFWFGELAPTWRLAVVSSRRFSGDRGDGSLEEFDFLRLSRFFFHRFWATARRIDR